MSVPENKLKHKVICNFKTKTKDGFTNSENNICKRIS